MAVADLQPMAVDRQLVQCRPMAVGAPADSAGVVLTCPQVADSVAVAEVTWAAVEAT
jgi:hypothetical protein